MGDANTSYGYEMLNLCNVVLICLLLSSPYLCVFGDDHVTRYMGADVDACERVDF